MGNFYTNLFPCANHLEALCKYTARPNLILSWTGIQESVCCSAETSMCSNVHQSAVPALLDHPPTQCWNPLKKQLLNSFPRSLVSDLLKLWTAGLRPRSRPASAHWPWLIVFICSPHTQRRITLVVCLRFSPHVCGTLRTVKSPPIICNICNNYQF